MKKANSRNANIISCDCRIFDGFIAYSSIFIGLNIQWFRAKFPKKFIEVLDELELFIDKKVIFDEKKIAFSFQPRHFIFSG
jgi:hypothetical protein